MQLGQWNQTKAPGKRNSQAKHMFCLVSLMLLFVCRNKHLVIWWLMFAKIFCSLQRMNWSLKKELLGSFITKETGILDVTSIQISSKFSGKCCDLKRKPATSWRANLPQFRMACWFLLGENLGLMDHQENPLWQLNADGSCTNLEQLTSRVAVKNSARSGTTRASLNLDI